MGNGLFEETRAKMICRERIDSYADYVPYIAADIQIISTTAILCLDDNAHWRYKDFLPPSCSNPSLPFLSAFYTRNFSPKISALRIDDQ